MTGTSTRTLLLSAWSPFSQSPKQKDCQRDLHKSPQGPDGPRLPELTFRLERYRRWGTQVPCNRSRADLQFPLPLDEELSFNTIRTYCSATTVVWGRLPDRTTVGFNQSSAEGSSRSSSERSPVVATLLPGQSTTFSPPFRVRRKSRGTLQPLSHSHSSLSSGCRCVCETSRHSPRSVGVARFIRWEPGGLGLFLNPLFLA